MTKDKGPPTDGLARAVEDAEEKVRALLRQLSDALDKFPDQPQKENGVAKSNLNGGHHE